MTRIPAWHPKGTGFASKSLHLHVNGAINCTVRTSYVMYLNNTNLSIFVIVVGFVFYDVGTDVVNKR